MHISNAPAGLNKLYTSRLQHVLPVADPGLSVRGGVLSRRYKRGWVREGALPPPAPARGYGGAIDKAI